MSGELVFWFIDERADRMEHLQQDLKGLSIPMHFRIRAEAGRFHEKVGPVLESIEANGTHIAPTFAFIDPFGFSGIPFSLIERLLKHPRCEVFITFMVDAFNRFLEHPKGRAPVCTGREELVRALRGERVLVDEDIGENRRARSELERPYAEDPDYEDVVARSGFISCGSKSHRHRFASLSPRFLPPVKRSHQHTG